MTDTNSYLLSDARKALAQHHLLSGIQSLQGMATLLKAWNVSEELEDISHSYHTLLNYFSQGIKDPERIQLYKQFLCRSYEVSDILERLNELRDETSFYTTSLHTLQKLKGTDSPLESSLQKDTDYRYLFQSVWLSAPLKKEEELAIQRYLADNSIDIIRKSLLISALTLGAMKFFDIAKIRILIQYASNKNSTLRARALTGTLFMIFSHSDRFALYPQVSAQLELLMDNQNCIHELELIQAQLFLSLETKRIERNLQEEIIPRMMKRMESLKLNRALGLDEIKERLAEAELNPEWEKYGTPSKLGQYMEEFAKLQKRGADLYMGTFKVLKQRLPFFREISNWFCPFSLDHPEIPCSLKSNKTLKVLIHSNGLCDSDKYSFCLIADQFKNSIPEDALNGLITERANDLNQSGTTTCEELFKEDLRSYIQGFYRFSNLYLHKEQFPNPFQKDLFIADYKPFDQLLENQTWLIRMADFTFKDKLYLIARALFERIAPQDRTFAMCQKLGFCYEQENNLEEAIRAYTWANDMMPSDAWTLRRLSTCLRLSGRFEEALNYYNELSKIYPEDANIAFRQGECQLHLREYNEAFKGFFKADYLQENTGKTMRAIAWCSLLTHKLDQAERYYSKIIASKPNKTDYLNAGHTAWFTGNLPLAISRYNSCLPDESPENFLQEDLQLIHEYGLTDDDICVMIDAVLDQQATGTGHLEHHMD